MKQIVWTFWTGTNPLTEARTRCLENLKRVTQAEVILVTPATLAEYIKHDSPFHPGYEFLSLTGRSDYLRAYFMYHHGGGYSDIKESYGSWKRGFAILDKNPEIWMVGTCEKKPTHVGYQEDEEVWEVLQKNYKSLPENGAYIGRAGSPLFKEILDEIHRILDIHLDALKSVVICPIRARKGDGSGYPLRWTEVGGSIVHKIAYKYKNHIAFALPGFSTNNYL
jgi:hypothetical protein